MKLSDIIDQSTPEQKIIWAIIRLEFDTLLKPIGKIPNESIRKKWQYYKAMSYEWISGNYPQDEDNPITGPCLDKEKIASGSLSFERACEYVGVSKKTLMSLFYLAIEHGYHYFPISIEFKAPKNQEDDQENKRGKRTKGERETQKNTL